MEHDAGLEMGKRPSRQRRHLPTAVTSAANTRSTSKQNNIPLLKMTFRETCQEEIDNVEGVSTTSGYSAPINSSASSSSRRKRTKTTTTKTKYGYNNNDLKRRTQEFIKTNNKYLPVIKMRILVI